jgi:hypothetical protein
MAALRVHGTRIADWSVTDYGSGIAWCLVGLVKKSSADLLLAPGVLKLSQTVALHPDTVSARVVWPILLGQLLYIYLDFSGYTDLALGTGRALGWRLPENFNWPLAKSNLQRYWQSWHMTLSNWVMRRVYFPAFMQSRSPILAAVCAMLAIGVWHQPDFAWALHHGIGLGVTIKCRDVGFREGRNTGALGQHTKRPCHDGAVGLGVHRLMGGTWIELYAFRQLPDFLFHHPRRIPVLGRELIQMRIAASLAKAR